MFLIRRRTGTTASKTTKEKIMRRIFLFSIFLLPLLLLSLTSCDALGSRFFYTLNGEENRIISEERELEIEPKKLNIDWREGDVKLRKYSGDKIKIIEESWSELDSRTRAFIKKDNEELSILYCSPTIWLLPFLLEKDITLLIPEKLKDLPILVNGESKVL